MLARAQRGCQEWHKLDTIEVARHVREEDSSMAKKISNVPMVVRPREKSVVPFVPPLHQDTRPIKLWLISILVAGVIILGVVSFTAWNWLKHVNISLNPTTVQAPITTLNVQRSATYAGLDFTVNNAQYATSFNDDGIHLGNAVVRLNMTVANKHTDQINVIYYDVARLLMPGGSSIAPTNVHLSVGPKPRTSETGWLDFAVPREIHLDTLKLRLGSVPLGEYLVTIPFKGAFDASIYADRTSPQTLDVYYTFQGHVLIYHLLSADVRFSYKGMQAKAGQQYYVLNFTVDNPNGVDVQPGLGFDYIRLVLSGVDRPPQDNSLPYGFKAGATSVGGHVAFAAPVGLNTLTMGFLVQYGSAESDYDVTL